MPNLGHGTRGRHDGYPRIAGVFARAVFIVDTTGNVTQTELVSEIATEPNYAQARAALS